MTRLKRIVLAVFCLVFQTVSSQETDVTIQQKINNYISQAKLDSAKTYIKTKLVDVNQGKNKNNLTYQLVKVLFIQSEYNEALKQAFLSLDEIDDQQQKVKFNFMIGCIYSAISDYEKSIDYFDLVVTHNQDPSLAVQTHLLLSQLHVELADTLKAQKSITEAYKITSTTNVAIQMKDHVAMQYNFFNKNYEACKQQNFKIINDTTSFLNAKSYAYNMIGDCLVKQDSLKEATPFFNEFLKLTVETKDPEQIKVAATKLIEVYEKLGNQEKANVYHKIYNEAVGDSLSFSVEKYRDLYDLEKNRELEEIKSKTVKSYVLFGLIFSALLLFGSYYYIKNKNKLKALVKKPGKKIVISKVEIEKIKKAIERLIDKQLFLKPNITRKSFCLESEIKSERYLSHYINEKYKKSFSAFINDLRIKYAYKCIQNDPKFRSYKIEEIAKASGFGSKKSFERVFLATYNETPFKLISRLNS